MFGVYLEMLGGLFDVPEPIGTVGPLWCFPLGTFCSHNFEALIPRGRCWCSSRAWYLGDVTLRCLGRVPLSSFIVPSSFVVPSSDARSP